MAQKINDYYLKQWQKPIISFFDYLPIKYEANAIRYEEFAEEVCRLTGATNAYKAITIEGERLAVHENQNGKNIESVHIIKFNRDFFNGKKVLLFDDIITRGFSYARFACEIENFGAEVLGGYFLGRTLLK